MDTPANYSLKEKLVVVESLSVVYNDRIILRDIGTERMPFTIWDIYRENMKQGQTVAVLGRSGRGKSTFFKALTGIATPTTGSIRIPDEDKPGQLRNVREGNVGFVQQNFPLSRNQTVVQMLEDAAVQGHIPQADRDATIRELLETWGLVAQKHLAPNQLSGGQRQRVAIIEQLLCSHFFMVFDEPFSGLDVCNIEDVKASFRKITDNNEISTIIFSTHDIDLAVELADVIYIIGYEQGSNGEWLEGGTIVGCYDLKQLNLAWQGFSPGHAELSRKIKDQFKLT